MATNVVIVGGGFSGVAVAQGLAKLLPRETVDLHLVSRDNFLLFHPMLPEVGGGSIEAHHILNPLRQLCPRTTVTTGVVEEVDLTAQTVTVSHGLHKEHTSLPYDFLVIAVGAVTNFSELTGLAQHAFGLKTVGDALYLRNHLIDMLEEADLEADPRRRREILTFVVAGGGFSGVEMVAELNDFVREAAKHYRRIDPKEIRVVLLHAGNRILPELSVDLGSFAQRLLQRRGVEVRLQTMLAGATENEAVLKDADAIPTRTLVCTIGTAANPLVVGLACPKDERGRMLVDEHLRVKDYPNVWALGDCTAVPNAATGKLAPPTAQFAQREGKLVAHNIAATIRGRELKPFGFPGLGQFVSLGHRSAVAEIMGMKLEGFPAWFMWRTVYLQKLPSLSRKTRVALDWTLDLLFGRDITQLPLARGERLGRAHYEPGDIVVHQGDVGDQFFLITEGEVEIVREEPGGQEVVLNRLGPGEYFGEVALLRNARRNATVRAVTAVNVVTVGRDDFTMLARNWAGLRHTLQSTVTARA